MKEMMIFIIFTSISITFEWTVYTDQQCRCEDLNLESECSSANCVWSNSYICQNVDCINLDQSQCLTYKESCAYNTETKSCTSFDYCNALEGESTDDCSSQNLSCTWLSGSQCISLSDCSQFNSSNCPSTCHNNGSSCISYSQCSQINQQLCSTQNNCFWEGQCKSIQCSNYLSSDTCLFSQDQSSNVQPCLWKSDACVNAESQDVLNAQTCFANTAQMHHWAPKDQKKPEYYCKPCYQFLFTIQIVLITLQQNQILRIGNLNNLKNYFEYLHFDINSSKIRLYCNEFDLSLFQNYQIMLLFVQNIKIITNESMILTQRDACKIFYYFLMCWNYQYIQLM